MTLLTGTRALAPDSKPRFVGRVISPIVQPLILQKPATMRPPPQPDTTQLPQITNRRRRVTVRVVRLPFVATPQTTQPTEPRPPHNTRRTTCPLRRKTPRQKFRLKGRRLQIRPQQQKVIRREPKRTYTRAAKRRSR